MNKFVIIPEKEERNIFRVLPLILSIVENFEDPEINIIHTINLKEQIKSLPFKVRFFQVDEKDYGPVASIKLAAKLDDLFNITHALIFRQEVGVLQFVKSLKAKNRIGWKSLVNDVFLTESVENSTLSSELPYFSLWKKAKILPKVEEPRNLVNRVEHKAPENFFKDNNALPFVFLSGENFSDEESFSTLANNLADSLKDLRLILWSKKESQILKDLEKSNSYVVDASRVDESLLFHYITRCQSFITTIEWHSHLSCYLGLEPYLIGEKHPASLTFLKYSPVFLKNKANSFIIESSEGERLLTPDELVNLILRENDL